MATFAFVHGAYHSGACFDLLSRALAERGHAAVAPDLPSTDPAAGAAEYASTVEAALGDGGGDLVVVGHSMGGLSAPVLAARVPARRIVYLAGLIPVPGSPWDAYAAANPDVYADYRPQVPAIAHIDGSTVVPFARASEVFFHDCPWPVQQRAFAQLRPQQWKVSQEVCPLDAMPDVGAASIVCTEDRSLSPDWSRRVAKERDVEVIEMPGGHAPFYSRPAELAAVLDSLA